MTLSCNLKTALRFLQGTQQDWNLRRLPYVLSKACSDRVENALTGVLSLSEKDQLVGLIRPPFAAQVTRESLQTLAPNVRLNDCIINYFMAKNNLLQARRARVEKLGAPVVHCASSHFFTMLKTNGYSQRPDVEHRTARERTSVACIALHLYSTTRP